MSGERDGRDDQAEPDQLDDVRNRDELRERYYGLLQELRVVVPGVQVLLAFLLTVPFATGFRRLDESSRQLFGVALTLAMLSVVVLLTPTLVHRFGARTARSARLRLSIVSTRIGMALMGPALLLSMLVVLRLIFSGWTVVALMTLLVLVMVAMWIAVPWFTWRVEDEARAAEGARLPRLE